MPSIRDWVRTFVRAPRAAILLAATSAFLAVTIFRLVIVASSPYPPSDDVGGDLYSAQQWMGNSIPGLWIAIQPPLYYWLVVIPFTRLLGPFGGPELYIALIPALLIFPGYFLCRTSSASVPSSLLGGVLLATSSALSLMVSWNGSYNALAIVFLAGFLAALTSTFERPRSSKVLVTGILLGLIAATHLLTFVVALLSLAASLALFLALRRPRARTLRLAAQVVVVGVLACLPMVPIYLATASGVANVGVGGYTSLILNALKLSPFFLWGFQSTEITGLFLVDLLFTLLALGLLWTRPPSRTSAIVLTGTLAAIAVIPLLEASNAFRALYFLPIPAIAGIPFLCDELGRILFRVGARAPGDAPTSSILLGSSLGRARRIVRRPARPTAALTVSCAAVMSLVVLNGLYSAQTLQSADRFYTELTPEVVAGLNWLEHNTPPSAHVYDSLRIAPWIWGLSHRLAYSPETVADTTTQASYQATLDADYVSLGVHLSGDGALVAATNAPSSLGVPNTFVKVPGIWAQVSTSQTDRDFLLFHQGGRTVNESLASATYAGVSAPTIGPNSVSSETAWFWPGAGIWAQETLTVNSTSIDARWTSNTTRVEEAQTWLGLAPVPQYFVPLGTTDYARQPSVTSSFSGLGGSFSLTVTGANLTQVWQPNGWCYVWATNSTGVDMLFAGASIRSPQAPWAMDTSGILHRLGISYATGDPYVDYFFFGRLSNGAVTGAASTLVFVDGSFYIFELRWA